MPNIAFTLVHPVTGIQSIGVLQVDAATADPVSRQLLSQMHLKRFKKKSNPTADENIRVSMFDDQIKELLGGGLLSPPVRIDHQIVLAIRERF